MQLRHTLPLLAPHHLMAVTFLDAPQMILEDARISVASANSRILVLEPARPRLDAAPILLDQPQSLIGCSAECPIRLPEPGINSRHALLLRDGPQIVIKALDRRTWLNGYPVTESRLREGDLLAIGPVEFRVRRAHAEELTGKRPAEPRHSPLAPDNSRCDGELTQLDSGRSLLDAGRSQLEDVCSLLDSERSRVEALRAQLAAERTQFETARSRFDSERSQFDAQHSQLQADRAAFEVRSSQFEAARPEVESARAQRDAERAQLEAEQTEFETRCVRLDSHGRKWMPNWRSSKHNILSLTPIVPRLKLGVPNSRRNDRRSNPHGHNLKQNWRNSK